MALSPSLRLLRLAFQSPPLFPTAPRGRLDEDDPTWASPASLSSPCSRVRLRLVLLLCLGPTLSHRLDPGRVEVEARGLPVPLEA